MASNPKALFDSIRTMLGRGLRQSEVDRINAALEGRTVPDMPHADGAPGVIGPDGIALIKKWEGCHKAVAGGKFIAYPDPGTGGAPWTIGWGSTGPGIRQGTVWTQAECDARLEQDLVRYALDVRRAIGDAPTTQRQFDALVSFHYNTGAIGRATLTLLHKSGNFAAARAEFGKWVHAGGKRLTGLVNRRAEEARLYGS